MIIWFFRLSYVFHKKEDHEDFLRWRRKKNYGAGFVTSKKPDEMVIARYQLPKDIRVKDEDPPDEYLPAPHLSRVFPNKVPKIFVNILESWKGMMDLIREVKGIAMGLEWHEAVTFTGE